MSAINPMAPAAAAGARQVQSSLTQLASWPQRLQTGLKCSMRSCKGNRTARFTTTSTTTTLPKAVMLGRLRQKSSMCCCTAVDAAQASEDRTTEPHLAEDDETITETVCLLQAFSWTSSINNYHGKSFYAVLEDAVDDLAACGFTDFILPPCCVSSDTQGFAPTKFYDLNTAYGSEEHLRSLLSKLHKQRVRACVELVINRHNTQLPDDHLIWKQAAHTWDETFDWESCLQGSGKLPETLEDKQGEAFGMHTVIDHSDPIIQSDASGWLAWLRKTVGFDAWCFDLAKAFDPIAVYMYCQATSPKYALGDVWNNMRYNGPQLEYDQDQHRQDLCNWVKATRGTASVFDYTTKGLLQQAVERCEYWRLIDPKGRPPGLIGWWPGKAVTFVDNHSTGSVPQHWPFPAWGVMRGYAYILTHPGTPCVFWDHLYDWKLKDEIVPLVQIRHRNKLHARSEVKILTCHPDLYIARIGDNVDKQDAFQGVIVKIGPSFDMRGTEPGPEWEVAASGQDFCIWQKCNLS
eukprot:SM000064S19821  [mRNA]  locus=s64:690266:693561:- [translate_table: standard]